MIYNIKTLQKKCKSIAIITKTDTEAIDIYKKLKPELDELTLITSTSKNFNNQKKNICTMYHIQEVNII